MYSKCFFFIDFKQILTYIHKKNFKHKKKMQYNFQNSVTINKRLRKSLLMPFWQKAFKRPIYMILTCFSLIFQKWMVTCKGTSTDANKQDT